MQPLFLLFVLIFAIYVGNLITLFLIEVLVIKLGPWVPGTGVVPVLKHPKITPLALRLRSKG